MTLPTVTISDPLTKFLLPFLVTLCSADLEAPVPPRVFQPRDTEQRGWGGGVNRCFRFPVPLNQRSTVKGSCHCDESGRWLMATKWK